MRIEDVRTREDLAEYCRETGGSNLKIFKHLLDDEVKFQLWTCRRVAQDLEHVAFKLRQLKSERDSLELADLVAFVGERATRLGVAMHALHHENTKAERFARRLAIPAPAAE